MSELPQIHDWMFNLLTPGQWIFIYILSLIIIFVLGIVVTVKEGDDWVGIGFGVGIIAFPIFAFVMLALGNFISFMIFLWFGVSS